MRKVMLLLAVTLLAGCASGETGDTGPAQVARSYDACAEFGYTPGTTLYRECDLHMTPFYDIYR